MAAFASLVVSIGADLSSLDAATKKALGQIRAFSANVQQVGTTLAVGLSAPIAAFAGTALKSAADLESLKLGLTAVTGSAVRAGAEFEKLREVAKLPGLGFQEAVRGSTNLQAVGFSADQSRKILLEFGNALAQVGRGRDDLNEVIRQLGQLASRGKVTADNLKPIIERVPQVASIIRKEFGTIDTEVLQKMNVSSERLIQVLLGGLSQLSRTTGGLSNDFENLKDTMVVAFAKAGDALRPLAKTFIDEFAVPALEKMTALSQKFAQLSPSTQGFAIAVGGLAVALPPLIYSVGALSGALTTLYGALGGPIGLIAALTVVLTGASLAGSQIADALEKARSKADSFAERATRFNTHFGTASERIATTKDNLLDYVTELNKTIPPTVGAGAAVKTLGEEVKKAKEHFPKLTEVMNAQGIAGQLLNARVSILQAEYSKLVQEIAQGTLNIERGKSGWLDFAEALGLGENVFFKTKVGIDSMEGAIDSFVKRAAQAGPEVKLAFDSFKAEADLTKFENQQRGRSGVATTKRLFLDKDALKDQGREFSAFSRQVSLVSNDLARDLAKLAFSGGKFAETMTKAFKSFGESLVRLALEKQIGRLVNMVLDFASKVRGLDKVIGAVFGGGVSAASSAAGSAAGAAGSAAGSIAVAGSSAAGAAASGTLGIVGAVAGVATAVSSIIGNFQFAGMNKSLDIIVKHTLETSLQLQSLQASANQWWPKLGMIHDRLAQIIASGVGVFNAPGDQGLRIAGAVAGGGGGNTFNFYITNPDPRAVTDEINRYLRQRGL